MKLDRLRFFTISVWLGCLLSCALLWLLAASVGRTAADFAGPFFVNMSSAVLPTAGMMMVWYFTHTPAEVSLSRGQGTLAMSASVLYLSAVLVIAALSLFTEVLPLDQESVNNFRLFPPLLPLVAGPLAYVFGQARG